MIQDVVFFHPATRTDQGLCFLVTLSFGHGRAYASGLPGYSVTYMARFVHTRIGPGCDHTVYEE